MTFDPAQLDSITGFLLPNEAALLYQLAADVPKCGTIVEVGSYQGKSTVALALGVKTKHYFDAALLYAIDPRHTTKDTMTDFSMTNQSAFFKNLLAFDVSDTVRVINLSSWEAHLTWSETRNSIDLVWIDGNHNYQYVSEDAYMWSQQITPDGKIIFHDYNNPDFPGVRQAVNEFVANSKWQITQTVDTIAVLECIKE